ncbi:Phage portal protein [Cronobacter sakazakii 680]|nr:Phage portal protein [Cronobacter sakazakii 680]
MLDEAFVLEGDTGTEFDVNALLRMDSERRIKNAGRRREKYHPDA